MYRRLFFQKRFRQCPITFIINLIFKGGRHGSSSSPPPRGGPSSRGHTSLDHPRSDSRLFDPNGVDTVSNADGGMTPGSAFDASEVDRLVEQNKGKIIRMNFGLKNKFGSNTKQVRQGQDKKSRTPRVMSQGKGNRY